MNLPRQLLVPILEAEVACRADEDGQGGLTAACHAIAASKAMTYEAAYRRIYAILSGETEVVTFEVADKLLTGLDRQDAWYCELEAYATPEDTVTIGPSVCEDCGREVEPGVKPIDLFRYDPTAMQGRVWDSTKQKWVRRPRNARAGGRRFRPWTLCRSCRAEAVRQRALNASSNGRGKTLRTKDRIEPRRGGRPRLLTDDELRDAHRIYMETGLSRREIAARLHASREKGTQVGYEQALLYGWRRLNLSLRSRSAQIAISVHGAGVDWKPKEHKRCKAKTAKGRRCTQWVRREDGEPASDGLCWNHSAKTRKEAA